MAYSKSRFQASDQHGVDNGPTLHQPPSLDMQNLIGNQGLLSLLTNNGAGAKQTADACHHEVTPGETLWGISEQVFGDGMGWSDLYEHKPNKEEVGDNPDLIKPKQLLDVCGLEPRNKDLTMEGYLKILKSVEERYTAPDANGNKKSSLDFVAAMRALYGYEGGLWEGMIPDAKDHEAPDMETYPELKLLFKADADGTLKKAKGGDKDVEGTHNINRRVTLPNGDTIDPGHLFTGIDAVQHPDESVFMKGGEFGVKSLEVYKKLGEAFMKAASGNMDEATDNMHGAADTLNKSSRVDNQDGATWSGDVGQAIVKHTVQGQAAGKSTDDSFKEWASEGDLNGDLDGFVLGHKFDQNKGLTEQLQSYYLDSKNPQGYEHRYSQFCDMRGLDTDDHKQLTDGAKEEIKQAVDAFSRPYSGRHFTLHDSGSDTTKDMNQYFEKYLEDGLMGEPKSTP